MLAEIERKRFIESFSFFLGTYTRLYKSLCPGPSRENPGPPYKLMHLCKAFKYFFTNGFPNHCFYACLYLSVLSLSFTFLFLTPKGSPYFFPSALFSPGPFLGSGSNRGRSPVEWGDFWFVSIVCLFIVHPYPPSRPFSQA